MAISFVCPDCKAVVTFDDDWAGHRAPCRRCGSYITVPERSTATPDQIAAGDPPAPPRPASPPPLPEMSGGITDRPAAHEERGYGGGGGGGGYQAPERRDYDLDRPFRRDDDFPVAAGTSPGWNAVRIGLGMMFWSIIVMIILAVFAVVLGFAMAGMAMRNFGGGGPRMDAPAWAMISLLLGGALLITVLIYIVGQCMCCAAPYESGARGYALASIICFGIVVILYVVMIFVMYSLVRRDPFGGGFGGPDSGMILQLVLSVVIMAVALASHIFFILCLRAIGRYFHDQTLVGSTVGYLILYLVTFALSLGAQCLIIAVRSPDLGPILMCVGLLLLGLAIAVIVWFLMLLHRARSAISYGARGARY